MKNSCCQGGKRKDDWKDRGPDPMVIDPAQMANRNPFFRRAVWTGEYLQMTVMSIPVGSDIGKEIHPDTDQYIFVSHGVALAEMGKEKDCVTFRSRATRGNAIFVPAGTWHNVKNIGPGVLKLYTLYAPPHHPAGTLHRTKKDAQEQEY